MTLLALAVLALDGVALIAQATGGPDAGALLTFLNYGVLGALVVLLLTGQLRRGSEVKEANERTVAAEARAVAAEARERELERTVRAEVVPAMVNLTNVAGSLLARSSGS